MEHPWPKDKSSETALFPTREVISNKTSTVSGGTMIIVTRDCFSWAGPKSTPLKGELS